MPLTEQEIAFLKEKAWLIRRNTVKTMLWGRRRPRRGRP